ncbi:MAG: SURF1 family cytochrome oxidase biogenesis protein [Phenylobacterium sp.]|uniref:SURF1 family protein n=1 Tax=Phenylobacterium sp. TaxID=1871053 RepID=UPI002723AE76|nr:SURF1 family cytochrome oxidase biogenesis protein [Phenylobacterium sp.]MDO8902836.1 SURF1 family cytochrome oxidase biogenesis protein [Phenylobacterium sp.]MDP2212556.1 SURF1 family cytochrome oxidase biogenesis protein [Phenylobacterium sp.]
MTEPAPPRRIPIGLTLATLISLGILITLGVWQIQRMDWKSDLLDQIETRSEAAPRPAGEILALAAGGEDLGFYRVSLDCPGLATAPFVQLYAIKDGQAGQRLISACPVSGGGYQTLLVDRGFVPDTVAERPQVSPDGDAPVAVIGLLRNPDPANFVTPDNRPDANIWYSRDVAAMAQTLGAPAPAPVFLLAENTSNPDFPALEPTPLPGEIANRHLEYALTWFGLAGALIAVYAAVLRRRWKP